MSETNGLSRNVIEEARQTIEQVFARGLPVYLAFSGGKDALALLKLCEPFRGRFKLVWTNTGYAFPHVEKRIRDEGERFGLIELKSDLHANWKANGWPSELMTVESAISSKSEIRLQPWAFCCSRSKSLPIAEWVARQSEPVIILHGQRKDDNWRAFKPMEMTDRSMTIAPLVNWTTDDVLDFLKAKGVELPSHYADLIDSLDCWICPAQWSMDGAQAYGRFLRRDYPEYADTVMPMVKAIYAHMTRATETMRKAMKEGSSYGRGRT